MRNQAGTGGGSTLQDRAAVQGWVAVRHWPARRFAAAGLAGLATVLLVAVPTDLIDTPVFGRAVPPTWWAWPVVLLTGVLSGLLFATYVVPPAAFSSAEESAGQLAGVERDGAGQNRSVSRAGTVGGVLSLLAVGCPVCNKLVLLALGTSGALNWFAPAQPVLAVASLGLLGWALHRRIEGEWSCPVPAASPPPPPVL